MGQHSLTGHSWLRIKCHVHNLYCCWHISKNSSAFVDITPNFRKECILSPIQFFAIQYNTQKAQMTNFILHCAARMWFLIKPKKQKNHPSQTMCHDHNSFDKAEWSTHVKDLVASKPLLWTSEIPITKIWLSGWRRNPKHVPWSIGSAMEQKMMSD